MKQTLLICGFLAICFVSFMAGRETAPQSASEERDRHYLDSITRKSALHEKRELMWMDSAHHYKTLSDTWFKLYNAPKPEKKKNKQQENETVRYIDNADLDKLDSMLSSRRKVQP